MGDRVGEGKKEGEKNGMGWSCGCKMYNVMWFWFRGGERGRCVRIVNVIWRVSGGRGVELGISFRF